MTPLLDFRIITPDHTCECCGTADGAWVDHVNLYVCDRCTMPEGKDPSQTEWQAYFAILRISAGLRKIDQLKGEKISAWFRERYERLGLR